MGTSGAGALSLALALNEALDLNLSREEVAQVAHVAEVECRTGLGTVIAETYGGMEIRVEPGAPGVGKIVKIPLRGEYVVVCLPFSPISTRSVLSNESFRKRINELGGKFVEELVSRPRPEELMRISRSFTEHVGLITERVKKVMKTADEAALPCGMPMFGEAVFSLLRREQAEELLEIFKRHRPTITNSSRTGDGFHNVVLAEVDEKGVRLV